MWSGLNASGLLWVADGADGGRRGRRGRRAAIWDLVGDIAEPTSAFSHLPAPSFHMHDQSTGPVIKRNVRVGRRQGG